MICTAAELLLAAVSSAAGSSVAGSSASAAGSSAAVPSAAGSSATGSFAAVAVFSAAGLLSCRGYVQHINTAERHTVTEFAQSESYAMQLIHPDKAKFSKPPPGAHCSPELILQTFYLSARFLILSSGRATRQIYV